MEELFLIKVNLIVSRGGYSSTLDGKHLFVSAMPPGVLYGNPPGFIVLFTAVGSNISAAVNHSVLDVLLTENTQSTVDDVALGNAVESEPHGTSGKGD